MMYAKRLWDNVVITDANTSNLLAFRTLQLLLNLSAGKEETSPYDLHELLVNSEFTQESEQQDSHELLMYL